LLEGKSLFLTGLNGIYLPMQLDEVALLLIGLTKTFRTKSSFDQNLLDKIRF
jgi:hypothetical protein